MVPTLSIAGEMSVSVLEVGKEGMLAMLQDIHHRDDTILFNTHFQD